MKIFLVHLRDGSDREYEAENYHRDGDHYVFLSPDGTKLDWVLADEVVSMSQHDINPGRPGQGF
jgi:hypothetical protein